MILFIDVSMRPCQKIYLHGKHQLLEAAYHARSRNVYLTPFLLGCRSYLIHRPIGES